MLCRGAYGLGEVRLESTGVLERQTGRRTRETEEVVAEKDLLTSLLKSLGRWAQGEAGMRVADDRLRVSGRARAGGSPHVERESHRGVKD